MNGVSIEEDDEHVTTILARIDDDDGFPTRCALQIGEERGKKETERPGSPRISVTTLCNSKLR